MDPEKGACKSAGCCLLYTTPAFERHREITQLTYLNSSCISATWSNKIPSRSHLIFLHSLWKSKATYLPKEKIFKTDRRLFILLLILLPSWLFSSLYHRFPGNSRASLTLGVPTVHTRPPSPGHSRWKENHAHTYSSTCTGSPRGPQVGLQKKPSQMLEKWAQGQQPCM